MKRLVSILAAALLLAALVLPASAAETPEICIYDIAGILTDDEYGELERLAQQISQEQQCAVYFLTLDDYRDSGNGTIFDVARGIFLSNDFGMGEKQDGVMLVLSMADRDYCLIANGFGDTALTDYGKDHISEEFLDNFGDNDWFGGCLDYLTATDDLLARAHAGNIYDRGSQITAGASWFWSLVFAAGISAIICLCQRSKMKKKVVSQVGALDYLKGGDVKITRRRDVYTHTTEVRREIRQESSSSHSGGHSHSSDGFSGKSGKF